jgi:hypothetical protein
MTLGRIMRKAGKILDFNLISVGAVLIASIQRNFD